jgi:sugar phosphate isomerase/epimerase
MAADLGAPLVSVWSGAPENNRPFAAAVRLLCGRLGPVLEHADTRGIRIALEPEPGMLIESMKQFDELGCGLGKGILGLTLDVGHAHITETEPPESVIAGRADVLINVHLDDAAEGRHEHLPPGEGEIRFGPVLAAIADLDPVPFVSVELSRHGHDAVEQARRTREYLLKAGAGPV